MEDVRHTCREVFSASVYAEMMSMMLAANIPKPVVEKLTSELIRDTRPGQLFFGHKNTVVLQPAVKDKTNTTPYMGMIRTSRGSQHVNSTVSDACSHALKWMEAALTAESDSVLYSALESAGMDSDKIQIIFDLMKVQRPGEPFTLEGTDPDGT